MKRLPENSWTILLTAGLFATAVTCAALISDWSKLSQIGDFIAGFSAALAFLWLVAGFRLQSNELKLQRIALENQTKELRNSARFSGLSQIEKILERCQTALERSEFSIKSPSQIATLWIQGMSHWKQILESPNADTVAGEYDKWGKYEIVARNYISDVSTALRLYLEYCVQVEFDRKLSDENFIYIYSSWMKGAPYLSEHEGFSYMVAQNLFLFQPGLESMKCAFFYAHAKTLGKELFKDGVLEKMKQDLIDKKYSIPKIAEI